MIFIEGVFCEGWGARLRASGGGFAAVFSRRTVQIAFGWVSGPAANVMA